jgi:hypothetical protein
VKSSGWITLEAAETLFIAAKERVFASLPSTANTKKGRHTNFFKEDVAELGLGVA